MHKRADISADCRSCKSPRAGVTLETLKQNSWNLQQNLQQFGDGTVRKVIKTDEGSKKTAVKIFLHTQPLLW